MTQLTLILRQLPSRQLNYYIYYSWRHNQLSTLQKYVLKLSIKSCTEITIFFKEKELLFEINTIRSYLIVLWIYRGRFGVCRSRNMVTKFQKCLHYWVNGSFWRKYCLDTTKPVEEQTSAYKTAELPIYFV